MAIKFDKPDNEAIGAYIASHHAIDPTLATD